MTKKRTASPVPPARLMPWLYCALAGLPLAVLLYKLPHYGFTFPYWDEWYVAPLIDRAQSGQLLLHDYWVQHNEHRPLFPRLLMVGMALLTRWNVAWELAANVLFAFGCFVLLAWLGLRQADPVRRSWWLVPVFSFFVFSWGQMENWVWGWQIEWFMGGLCVVGGIVLLAGGLPQWPALIVAILLGGMASYSMANGLLYWFAALPVLLWGRAPSPDADARKERQRLLLRLLFWAAAAILVFQTYLIDYKKPEVSPSFSILWTSPLVLSKYVLLYLGSPVAAIFYPPIWHGPDPAPAAGPQFIPGLLGCVLFIWLLVGLFRKGGRVRYALTPWLSLAAYAVGGALLTGMGRAGFGAAHGLTSRYIGVSLLFWCGLAGLAALYLRERVHAASRGGKEAGSLFYILRFAIGVAVVAAATFGAAHQNRNWEDIARWKRFGWEAICYGFEDPMYLQDLCWDPQPMRQGFLPIMKRHQLSGIGAPPNPDRARAYVVEVAGFLKRHQYQPALVYLKTAEYLDPAYAGLSELRQQVQAELERARSGK